MRTQRERAIVVPAIALRARTQSFVLLFRPESVASAQDISQAIAPFQAPDTHHARSGLLPSRIRTTNETELSYTVSAVLVDLKTRKPLRAGSASRTVKHNIGFAEAPPSAPILAEIMTELGRAVLDD